VIKHDLVTSPLWSWEVLWKLLYNVAAPQDGRDHELSASWIPSPAALSKDPCSGKGPDAFQLGRKSMTGRKQGCARLAGSTAVLQMWGRTESHSSQESQIPGRMEWEFGGENLPSLWTLRQCKFLELSAEERQRWETGSQCLAQGPGQEQSRSRSPASSASKSAGRTQEADAE
jgi:hypothetical protein